MADNGVPHWQEDNRREPGYWFRRVKGKRPAVGWRAVPGYEACRFKVGARVVQAVRALPWWAKVLPVAVAVAVAVGFGAARVLGNPLPAGGGFSDTETVTMSFTVACPEQGCGGGNGNGDGKHNGNCSGGNGGGCSARGEGSCGGQAVSGDQGGTPAPQNPAPGGACDGAAESAALAGSGAY